MGVPLSVNSLTLKQFVRFEQLKTQIINEDDVDAVILRASKQLSCVTGWSLDHIETKIPRKKLEVYFKQIARLNRTKPSHKVRKTVWIRGKRYKYFKSEKNLNFNQYTAFKTYQEDSVKNINLCGSIAYLRAPLFGKVQFNVEECENIANDFLLYGKVGKVYGAIFFYMNELENLNLISQASLLIAQERIATHKEEMYKDFKALGLNMDGTTSSIKSQAETLLKKMNTSIGQQ